MGMTQSGMEPRNEKMEPARALQPPPSYFTDWRKSGGTGTPGIQGIFRIGPLELSPLFQPYRGMEEEGGSEGADWALLEATNGRAMMKYKTITTSES